MNSTTRRPHTVYKEVEALQRQVFDTLLLAMSTIGLPALVFSQWRSLEIGWGLRELVQLVFYTLLVGLTLGRGRVSTGLKAAFLMLLFFGIGLAGVLTLGVYAGGIFFLLIPAFIAAQFRNPGPMILTGLLTVGTVLVSALGFTVLEWPLPVPAAALLSNPLNWGVYVTSFCLLLVFMNAATRRHRELVERLLQETIGQRDALLLRNQELEQALAEIRTLRGIIPICSWCHKIRDDVGAWKQLESYISTHSEAQFSHGICPDCVAVVNAEP